MSEFFANAIDCIALVERVAGGDRTAEEEIASYFGPRVLVMLLTRTGNREAARDLAQDVLLSVVQSLRADRVRKAESLSSFVYGTARNLLHNHFRSTKAGAREVPLTPDHDPSTPGDAFEPAERTVLVEQLLSQVGPKDREILVRTLIEGEDPTDFAEAMGLSPEAIRQRKSRSIRKIMKAIAKESRDRRVPPHIQRIQRSS